MGCLKLTYYNGEEALEENPFFMKKGLGKKESVLKNRIDYYPFGSIMPGRKFNTPEYAYGHGGQLADDEITDNRSHYSAEYWEYDSRLGRRWNMDPVVYPWQSSYATFNNNPIVFNDPKGLKGNWKIGDDIKLGRLFNKSWYIPTEGLEKLGNSVVAVVEAAKEVLYKTGDVIKTVAGEITVNDYSVDQEFSASGPEKGTAGATIDITFKPYDGGPSNQASQYRWVQTYETNAWVDSSRKGKYPIGTVVQKYDFSDVWNETGMISYGEDGSNLFDIMNRMSRDVDVYMKFETSLVRVNDKNEVVEIITTLTWGFMTKIDGTSVDFGLKTTTTPSDFHLGVINSKEPIDDNYHIKL